jgi:3-oxoacyl-[acyl-carrier-protein] synthase-3
MKCIRILGTGSHVPPTVLTNHDLEKMDIDTTDAWIVQRTGIRERRIADPDTATSDLACEAARRALKAAGRSASDLDMIIMATVTPDTQCPSGANWLQAKIGARHAVTFDVTAACSGFVFALNVAQQYLMNGTCQCILVVAAEVMTRTVNWKDRNTCILWGDGAGAAVLATGEHGPELLSTQLHSDGSRGGNLLMPGGGSKTTPISHESVDKGLHYLDMIEAKYSFRIAVRCFIDTIREAAADNGIPIEQIDWFIPHQANIRMFHAISKHLEIPIEKFYVTIDKYGNVSSASCAIALDEAIRNQSIRSGHLVCLPVFGGGLTWGNAMIRW